MKNYYLFLDESGHHGLKTVDQQYPILLLCGCLIEEDYYNNEVTRQINDLKLKYFKTTEIILHFHNQYQIILNNGSIFVSSDRFRNRFADIDF